MPTPRELAQRARRKREEQVKAAGRMQVQIENAAQVEQLQQFIQEAPSDIIEDTSRREGTSSIEVSGDDLSDSIVTVQQQSQLSDRLKLAEELLVEEDPKLPSEIPDGQFYEPGMFTGITNIFKRTFIGGARDATQEAMESIEAVAQWMNDNVADLRKFESEAKLELPKVEEAQNIPEGLARGVVQFLTGFIPFFKATKALTGGRAISRLGQFAQIETSAAGTGAFVFDPHEERLSNLIEEFPQLSNPVTTYLQADPGDSAAEGRFKSALEGLGFGVALEGVVGAFRGTLKAIKANRESRGVSPETPVGEPDKVVVEETMTSTVGPKMVREGFEPRPNERVTKAAIKYKGKTYAGNSHSEAIEKASNKTGDDIATVTQSAKGMARGFVTNKRRYVTSEEADIFKVEMDEKVIVEKGLKEPSIEVNFSKIENLEGLDESINSIAKLYENLDPTTMQRMVNDAIGYIADNLDITPTELQDIYKDFPLTPQQIIAASKQLNISGNKLRELAEIADQSDSETDLYAFNRMMNLHAALLERIQGNTKNADKMIKSFPVLKGSKAKQAEDVKAYVTREGGVTPIKKIAAGLKGIEDPRDFNRAINRSVGRRISDALTDIWYFNLLSGPQTHVVNMSSSALTNMWRIGERSLAAHIAKLRGTQSNSVQYGEAMQMMYGLTDSFTKAFRMAGQAYRTGVPSDIYGKIETRPVQGVSAENFGLNRYKPGSIGHLFGQVVDTSGYIMSLLSDRPLLFGDELFRVLGANMEMRALAYRDGISKNLEGDALAAHIQNIVSNPPEELVERGLMFARENIFTTPLGETGQGIQRIVNRHPILKVVLPFVRVGVNLLKFAGKNTPLGLLSSSIRRDITRGGAQGDLALAKIAMGSAAMMVFANYAWSGRITGAGPADPALRQTWLQTHAPWSIKVGDSWYSYNRADPFGLFLGAAASYAELGGQMEFETGGEYIAGAVAATSRSIFSKTWLSSITDTIEMLHDPERFGERWIQRFVGTVSVPNIAAQFTRTTLDPVWRDVQSMSDAVYARTPGYSQLLPPRTNIWGEDILLQGGLGPDIISPIYKYNTPDTPIDNWIWENKVGIKMPRRTQEDVQLSNVEYYRFNKLAGNEAKDPSTGMGLYDSLNAIIAGRHPLSAQWQNGTDGPEGSRAMMVKDMINNFRNLAKFQLKAENPEYSEKVRARQREVFKSRLGFEAPF